MPAPRLKRDTSVPPKDIGRSEDPLIPALLTSVAQEVCAAMRASGALIAGVDSEGIRCVASAGNAPVPGSRLEPEAGLVAECFKTGKVVFRENEKRDPRAYNSGNARPLAHSAVAVPIIAEGCTVGAIEVFSSRRSAIYTADIAPLEGIADFLAPILAPAAVYETKSATSNSTIAAVQEPTPPAEADTVPRFAEGIAGPAAWVTNRARFVVGRFAGHVVSARAWMSRRAEAVAQHKILQRSLAGVAVVLAAVVLFVGFHARFVKSSNLATQRRPNEFATVAPGKPAEVQARSTVEGQGPAILSHFSPSSSASIARTAAPSVPASGSETPASSAAVMSTNPTIAAKRDDIAIAGSTERATSLPRDSQPAVPVDNQHASVPGSSAAAGMEAAMETPELPVESAASLPVVDVRPAAPAAIEAAILPRPAFVLDRTFKGHSGWVTSVAFSPDGRRLASGSWDQTVKFWDVPTGHELDTLGRKMKEVQAVALSRDGRWLAAENSNDMVTVWDATTGTEVRTLPSNKPLGPLGTNFVYSIAFSPDGRWLASGVDEKTVRLWDVNTGRVVRDLTTSRRSVIYAAFSPDGRWFASGDDDKSIRIWEASTGEEVRRLTGHRKPIYAVAFSPNGRWLASASADKTIKIWDVAEGREVHTLAGHGGSVTSLAFSPDGRWLASGSWDKTVKIWNVETGREVQTLGGGHERSIYTVAFDSRGRWLASGSEDGSISLWRLGGGVDRARLQ